MSFKVLTLNEKEEWLTLLKKLPLNQQDIYYTPEYYELFEKNGDGKALCFVFEKNFDIAMYPFLLNSINDSGYDLDDNYYDIQGAYGYNGIVSSSYSFSFRENFYYTFNKYCLENNIIAEFVRYNPIIENHFFADSFADLIINRKTVALNLDQSYDNIWTSEYSSKNRNMVRKGINTLFCKPECGRNKIDNFVKMYHYTMERIGADDYYYFDKKFFFSIEMSLPDNYLMINAYDNKNHDLMGALILLLYKDKAHYFLSARSELCNNNSVNNFLLDYAIKFAKKNKCKIFHLGGGTSLDDNDSLFKFKKTISKDIFDFYISKTIIIPKIYEKVCQIWEKKNPRKVKQYNNFLLKYYE